MKVKQWMMTIFVILGIFLIFYFLKERFTNSVWNAWNLPLSGRIIYLDAGHGGVDGGAEHGDAVEKVIALSITKKLRDYLQQQGALVLMTRETDKDLADEDTKGLSRRKVLDLKRRVELINSSDTDLYISIHLNSIPSSRWRGAQTFYSNRFIENKIVAEFIQEEFISQLGNTERKAKRINNIYLLESTKKPGALVEAGFLSNPEERDLLMDENYQEKIAFAIYSGIMRYFTDEQEKRLEQEKTKDLE